MSTTESSNQNQRIKPTSYWNSLNPMKLIGRNQKYLHLIYPSSLVYWTFLIYYRFWLKFEDCDYTRMFTNIFIAFMINNFIFWSYYCMMTSDPGLI